LRPDRPVNDPVDALGSGDGHVRIGRRRRLYKNVVVGSS
jgi:hypothetical protein